MYEYIKKIKYYNLCFIWKMMQMISSSMAQGGDGNFKNRKPIGKIGCCELGMAERIY